MNFWHKIRKNIILVIYSGALFLVLAIFIGSTINKDRSTTSKPAGKSDQSHKAKPLQAAVHLTPNPHLDPVQYAAYTSSNWAGYITPNGTYNAVSGNWITDNPTVSGNSISADATWIGIGGLNNTSNLIQVGTVNSINNGQITTNGFYELLPASSMIINTLRINKGDSISASISEVKTNRWVISLTDLTTDQSFSNTFNYIASNTNADWIEEVPAGSNESYMQLDNFNQVNFQNCYTLNGSTEENLSQSSAQSITMINSENQPQATSSVIGNNNDSFNIYRD